MASIVGGMMSKWTGQLVISRDPKGNPREWTTVVSLSFMPSVGGVRVIVPEGFQTDGASVPRALWWYASPFSGKHAAPALIHDYLYRVGCWTKAEADGIFLEAMLDCGVRSGKARAMAASTRLFGGRIWRRHRARDE